LFAFRFLVQSYFSFHNKYKLELARNPPDGVSVGLGEDENIFVWDIMIIGPPETLYEGGFFNAKLEFPADFPNAPPVMTFKTSIWHPNGKISLLHPLDYVF
jgi:ubiquitin-conjugating enzyme E2 G1